MEQNVVGTEGGFDVKRTIALDSGPYGTLSFEFPCLWGTGVPTLVEDSIVRGGWPGGTNVIDVDPIFVSGPAGTTYLSQPPPQVLGSPAVDFATQLASAVGLDCRTTSTNGMVDSGLADSGAHFSTDGRFVGSVPCAAPSALVITRGSLPTALSVVATVTALPWSDTPGVLSDPSLPLLFYRVEWPGGYVLAEKDVAQDTVRLRF
jgi:hypothetical protein